MTTDKKQLWKVYGVALAIPLIGGLAVALLTMDGMRSFQELNQPPAAPPGWVFPVAWTLWYALMGVSSAMIYLTHDEAGRDALRVYVLQLALNLAWSVLFFSFRLFLASFIWLMVMEALIVVMIAMFYSIKPLAAYLQIPYALWVAFAGYLNFATFLLN